jgi:hypothetical protein
MIRVITLKQPWATLIAEGYKQYEFRSWRTLYRGTLYIHAGKGIDKKAMKKFESLNLEYPTSRIVAKVDLIETIKLNNNINKILKHENEFIYGSDNTDGYAWLLDNVEKINSSIIINGKLGLWNYEGEL